MPDVIRDISPDSVEDERLGCVYTVRVKLARNSMVVDGKRRPLRLGLTATVDIDMGQRHITEYFPAPDTPLPRQGIA